MSSIAAVVIGGKRPMHLRTIALVLALLSAHFLWRALTAEAGVAATQAAAAAAPGKLVGLRGAARGGEDGSEQGGETLSPDLMTRAAWIAPSERSRR